ncbi:MAG: glycosyl hydrolase family 38 [Verrucomicrobia bacterium]|nr:glycosyl hydrolase family 38 [Verrucomicrobiota bacterium]
MSVKAISSPGLAPIHKHTSRALLLWLCFLIAAGGSTRGQAPGEPAKAAIESVSLAVSPLVSKTAEGERNLAVATIVSAGLSDVTVRLTSPAWSAPKPKTVAELGTGRQNVDLEIPLLTAATPVTVRIETAAEQRDFGPFTLQPPRKWTVYLAQHTHTDIGYTRPQTEILPEHLRYIDYALDYCDLTDSYPDDARFRWTCETSWAVREYLKGRPAKQIERLKKRVTEGRIEICGLMLNMSEIATESSLAALLRPLRAMKDDFGISVHTAMQNDVNGAGWCLPDYFSDIGIRYLTMCINKTRSILPFDKPTTFWWESPSGKRVLAYRADHYHLGNVWKIHEGNLEKFKPYLDKYLLSLEQRGYPFDRISVQFSGYHTDNSPPAVIECDLVRAWNEKFAWPKLRLSTSQEFLAYVEKEHSAELPVHRQAWPDWWTDGFGSAARETAAARETETAMQVNHGLLAMASVLGAQVSSNTMQRAAAIQDNLNFYHEHTYGAAESIDDRLAENTQVQWGEKASYVWSAVMSSAQLREEAFGLLQEFLPRADVPTLAVCNTLNWPRSGLVRVFIDHEMLPPDRAFRILDGAQPVAVQAMERRSEGTYWALWVSDVPTLGFKILRIETSDQPRVKETPGADSLSLENSFYKLALDADKGAIKSLVDKETGLELVDQTAAWGLGQCIYETMPNRRNMKPDVFTRTSVRNVTVKPGASGPIWKSLLLTAGLDGCATNDGVRAEIRLYDTEKRIELRFAVRKLAIPSPEALYIALPFQAPNSKMLYEAQGGCVTPGDDQIPGSSSDWQTLQSFIAIRSADGQIVTGSEQAPLVQLGDFNLGKWQPVTRIEKPHVYSWVMNNYWFTNFRTEQQGEFKFHYYLTSTKDTSRTFATRFGWGSRTPLATRVLPPVKAGAVREPQKLSALVVTPSNLLIVEARPTRNGDGIFLHLRELEGQPVTITEQEVVAAAEIQGADEVNMLEEAIQPGIESLTFKPYEVKFLRLMFR